MVVKSRKAATQAGTAKEGASKLPSIAKNQSKQLAQGGHDESNASSIKRGNDSTLDFTTLQDFDFNEFGKRQILEEFLSREEIKRYLYSLIFSPPQQ